jgi:hypothetical protein
MYAKSVLFHQLHVKNCETEGKKWHIQTLYSVTCMKSSLKSLWDTGQKLRFREGLFYRLRFHSCTHTFSSSLKSMCSNSSGRRLSVRSIACFLLHFAISA